MLKVPIIEINEGRTSRATSATLYVLLDENRLDCGTDTSTALCERTWSHTTTLVEAHNTQ